jgi:hypothetical protein
LGERGFEVVDTDEPGWTNWCDEDVRYLWREERIAELAEEHRRTLYVSGHLRDAWLGVPCLLQWPVVDDADAFVIEDLACLR